jgi:hypothetical protein
MNYPRLAITAIVGLVVYFGSGYLIEGWLIRDHFIPSQSVYRDISTMQKYMPLGLLSSLLAIFVMAMIYARVSAAPGAVLGVSSGAFFGLLFGILAACIHPISNFVTMNIDTRLCLETTASLVQWTLVGATIALLYKPVLRRWATWLSRPHAVRCGTATVITGTGPPHPIIGDFPMRRLFPSLTMDSGQTIYWNLISRMQTS